MASALTDLAPHFFQVAYVVPNLEEAEAWFGRTFGVSYFERMEGVAMGEGCRHRGGPSDGVLDISLGFFGVTQVELVKPAGGTSIHSEFQDAGGTGLHHIAFVVPDFAATTARLTEELGEPAADGVIAGGMRVDFAYYECNSAAASTIEILGFDAAARDFMTELKQKSRR